MPRLNQRSHRDQHRGAARALRDEALDDLGREPTGPEYRQLRRSVAARRRREQRQGRVYLGTDRATIRAAHERA